MYILGAGLSGCIAAIMNPQATMLEASPTPPNNHNAVLRFRSDKISKITGIPFKKVQVTKSIYVDGQHYSDVNPSQANLYSQKVTGKILPRSITNLESVERFIAPADLHRLLLGLVGESRIYYGVEVSNITGAKIWFDKDKTTFDRVGNDSQIISTVPMSVMSRITAGTIRPPLGPFTYKPIYTARYLIEDCSVYQTIYFPSPDMVTYRATLTGDNLIVEGVGDPHLELDQILHAFGLEMCKTEYISSGSQKFGKITPVPDAARKQFMFDLSRLLGVYSLGRFAVWRNILLDDVYEDIFAIRRMIEQSHYDVHKEMSK